ncbi:MAG: dihydroorotase [Oscillospiraceae bacterium]|nr:dihydroorotase [Oscillospiraceae bacterium]MDY2847772.1 dihydroorotase [Oscillospiraceae bacterium]
MADILIKNVRAIDETTDKICDILIENGTIAEIGESIDKNAERVIDGTGKTVMPALFDMHVHLRDPGFTHKEDVVTGCAAAAAGGFTGVVCMPNTKPASDNREVFDYIREKAAPTGVEVYPAGCITKGMQGGELADFDEYVSAGIKVISDDGRPVETAELMRKALELTNSNGLLAASHCEDLSIINGGMINKGKVSEQLGVKGMDRASEDSITAREIALAMSCNARIHICHVSTEGSISMIRDAKKAGVRVTCETAPHYFTYTDEKLLSRDADYRMNPPLREERDRIAVLNGVLDGTVDCIVTDHAPHTAEEKRDFLKAPNGVVGLETSLAATLTALYHTGKITLNRVVSIMSANPRRILGLAPIELKAGSTADLIIADIDREWTVIPEELHSKSKNSVFKGEKLRGKNIMTISKGRIIFESK